jgi:hypothetical protein
VDAGVATNLKDGRTRTNNVQRAVVGLSLDDIKMKAVQKPEFGIAQRDTVLKEVKDRKKTNKAKSGGVRRRRRLWE